jgi:hypothetical protein
MQMIYTSPHIKIIQILVLVILSSIVHQLFEYYDRNCTKNDKKKALQTLTSLECDISYANYFKA